MKKPGLSLAALAVASTLGCGGQPTPGNTIPVGLLLSYTGYLAANSINSERALLMAIDAANQAGGVQGHPVKVMARDTRSDPTKISAPVRELLAAGVPVFIGPDTHDLINQLRTLLLDRTVLLPSFATASVDFKPPSWFVMGAATARVGCELMAQIRADGHKNPLIILNPSGYNSLLAYDMSNRYGLIKQVVSTDPQAISASTVRPIINTNVDSYILAAFPPSASTLFYALSTVADLHPSSWYLSPTLHTPVFLDSLPKGALDGAHGVSGGTVAGASDFRAAFQARWQDDPLDDAYPFYDAAAVAVLALERAMVQEGKIPDAAGLRPHVLAVTKAGHTQVHWNELGQGLSLLSTGGEIEYVGLSGLLEFDDSGQTPAVNTKWWTVDDGDFRDRAGESDCRRGSN
jgi:ABC-type branched-subunit amino acid transport system substrate-binding protein